MNQIKSVISTYIHFCRYPLKVMDNNAVQPHHTNEMSTSDSSKGERHVDVQQRYGEGERERGEKNDEECQISTGRLNRNSDKRLMIFCLPLFIGLRGNFLVLLSIGTFFVSGVRKPKSIGFSQSSNAWTCYSVKVRRKFNDHLNNGKSFFISLITDDYSQI